MFYKYHEGWLADQSKPVNTYDAIRIAIQQAADEHPGEREVGFCGLTKDMKNKVIFGFRNSEIGRVYFAAIMTQSDSTGYLLSNFVGSDYQDTETNEEKLAAVLDFLDLGSFKFDYVIEGEPIAYVIAPEKPITNILNGEIN